MKKTRRYGALALAIAASYAVDARASGEQATPRVAITGQYELVSVSEGVTQVSMLFYATLYNPGQKDITGDIVLRDPRVANRLFSLFGEHTIPAGGSVRISEAVSVPRETYESWFSGDAPAVFINIQNERGDVALHRTSLSRASPKD